MGDLSDQIDNIVQENAEISRAAKAMIDEFGRSLGRELRSFLQDLSSLRVRFTDYM